MTAALLRPDLPVVARTTSPAIADRMRAFGTPTVVNPFDRFGDHLRLALHAPASYQLLTWLESGPGAELPERGHPPTAGRWVICGYGRFGRELTADLRAEGLDVTVVEPQPAAGPDPTADDAVRRRATPSDPAVLAPGRSRGRRRLRRRHGQRHDQPLAGRRGPPAATRTCSSPPGRTARRARRCSRRWTIDALLVPDRGGGARGVRAAQHAAAVAVPAGDAGSGRRRGRPA